MSDKAIKSVRRVFEVLELFDRERRPLAAKEIARFLDYPLTSAHALLKSMHELGYADFYSADWTYTPSRKLPALLAWADDFLQQETQLLEFVQALNRATRETVNVSRRINRQVKIVHGLESLHTVGISVKEGTLMPLTASLTGITLLATLTEEARKALYAELKTSDPEQHALMNKRKLTSAIDEVQRLGTVCRNDVFVQGIGAVCLPVKTQTGEVLVVGVVGPSDRIQDDQMSYRDSIRSLASEYEIEPVFPLAKGS